MAGAVLDFVNGYMGIERCQNVENEAEQFLMAHIYSKSKGQRVSSPVTVRQAMDFATAIVKQSLLADGHHEDELEGVAWNGYAWTSTNAQIKQAIEK